MYMGKCHCCGYDLEAAWLEGLHIISRPDRAGILRKYCSECVTFRLSGEYRRLKRREKHEKIKMYKREKHKYRKSLRERIKFRSPGADPRALPEEYLVDGYRLPAYMPSHRLEQE